MQYPSSLETTCRDARITVSILGQAISLWVNGIKRDEAVLSSSGRLSTSVQTGYEWHEFIEVVFQALGTEVNVVGTMNEERILETTLSINDTST